MREVPLRLHQFPMPATQGVRSEQGRQPLPNWTEPLENREHKTFLLPCPRVRDLPAQDNQLLAQPEQLEILRARRRRVGLGPVTRTTVRWHPPRASRSHSIGPLPVQRSWQAPGRLRTLPTERLCMGVPTGVRRFGRGEEL
jgi:hypothetical protein